MKNTRTIAPEATRSAREPSCSRFSKKLGMVIEFFAIGTGIVPIEGGDAGAGHIIKPPQTVLALNQR